MSSPPQRGPQGRVDPVVQELHAAVAVGSVEPAGMRAAESAVAVVGAVAGRSLQPADAAEIIGLGRVERGFDRVPIAARLAPPHIVIPVPAYRSLRDVQALL